MRKGWGFSHVLAVVVVISALVGQIGLSQSNDPPNPGLMVLETDFGDKTATSTFSDNFLSITTILRDKATGNIVNTSFDADGGAVVLLINLQNTNWFLVQKIIPEDETQVGQTETVQSTFWEDVLSSLISPTFAILPGNPTSSYCQSLLSKIGIEG